MIIVNITVPLPLNQSVQTGDIIYYLPLLGNQVGGFTTHSANQNPVKVGKLMVITHVDTTSDQVNDSVVLRCNAEDNVVVPSIGDFILFSKDRSINETSPIGYYGSFNFINNSKDKAELFTTATQIAENSK